MSSAPTYQDFAESELRGYSPTYFEWASAIAHDDVVLAMIEQLPLHCQQPNLLLASCRFLDVEPGHYAVFRNFLLSNWSQIVDVALRQRTHTNEPGRCAVLLPLLASLPQPLALLEVGASAGLSPGSCSLALPALEGARAIIKPEYRDMVAKGSPFGAEVSPPADADDWERRAAFMGRDPRATLDR